jgi:hypothetical protein
LPVNAVLLPAMAERSDAIGLAPKPSGSPPAPMSLCELDLALAFGAVTREYVRKY